MSDKIEFEAVIKLITEIPTYPPEKLPPYLIYFKREGYPVEHMMLNGFEELKNFKAEDKIWFQLDEKSIVTMIKLP